MRLLKILIIFLCLTVIQTVHAENTLKEKQSVSEKPKDPVAVTPPNGLIPDVFVKLGSGQFYSNKAIVVDKNTRTLTLWNQVSENNIHLIKSYPIDYGRKEGDKFKMGDLKTPEGVYFFQETLIGGKEIDYNEYGKRAFTMDYPNFWDKKERKTGSGIWLHAIPETKTLKRGSRGCVVVRNEAIEDLKKYISLKNMPIIVKDRIKYIKPKLKENIETKISTWLNQWKTDWENKSIEQYISHYHNDFRALKMNRQKWKTHKSNLNKKYEKISVNINEPLIIVHNDEITIRFLQEYQSDQHFDVGEKTLYVKKAEEGFKILHESWQSVSEERLAQLVNHKNDRL